MNTLPPATSHSIAPPHVNGNHFPGKLDDKIVLWNESARLLTNAITYFNSLILTRLLKYFEAENDEKKLEIIKQVSPVAWQNTDLNRTYSSSFEQNPQKPLLRQKA